VQDCGIFFEVDADQHRAARSGERADIAQKLLASGSVKLPMVEPGK